MSTSDTHDIGHGNDHLGDDDCSNLLAARIGIIVIMILCGLFVLIPYLKCCKKADKEGGAMSGQKIFFAVSACFSAGMLISISILHILPEANEMYK